VTPAQWIARAKKNDAPSATLLLGPEEEALAVAYRAVVDEGRSQPLSRDVARSVVSAILEAFK
jgi:hypothetical protein